MDLIKRKSLDHLLNKIGIVVEKICNDVHMGKVYIEGKNYSALSINGKEFDVDTPVEVLRVDGKMLYVRKYKSEK